MSHMPKINYKHRMHLLDAINAATTGVSANIAQSANAIESTRNAEREKMTALRAMRHDKTQHVPIP